jgi:hypothetical protein
MPKIYRDWAEKEAVSRRAEGEDVEWFDMIIEVLEEDLSTPRAPS